METENLFEKYKKHLKREGFLKALLTGVIFGFAFNFVFAVLSWLFFPHLFWIGFIFLAVITAAVTAVFYRFKYKPNEKTIARRLDSEYGLNERIITMTQFKDRSDDYIYEKQRKDALGALEKVSSTPMKAAIAATLITVASITVALSMAASVLPVITFIGLAPTGSALIVDVSTEQKWFDVSYEIRSGEGMIEGNVFQRVEKGGSTEGVIAVPDEDWVFSSWDDGLVNPYRTDTDVSANLTYMAIFSENEDLPYSNAADNEGSEKKEADDDPDKPPERKGQDGSGSGSGMYVYEPHNQVIDGETYYGDAVFDNAYEDVMDELSKNKDISDFEKEMIVSYFRSIEQ